jgi:hypothetical protein
VNEKIIVAIKITTKAGNKVQIIAKPKTGKGIYCKMEIKDALGRWVTYECDDAQLQKPLTEVGNENSAYIVLEDERKNPLKCALTNEQYELLEEISNDNNFIAFQNIAKERREQFPAWTPQAFALRYIEMYCDAVDDDKSAIGFRARAAIILNPSDYKNIVQIMAEEWQEIAEKET